MMQVRFYDSNKRMRIFNFRFDKNLDMFKKHPSRILMKKKSNLIKTNPRA